MSTPYVLNVDHQGTSHGDFCIYQTYEDQDDDIRSLVWFTKTAHPSTRLKFSWNIDYSFAWSEEGTLEPGMVFQPSEVRRADPMDKRCNSMALHKKNGAFCFGESADQTPQGHLGIKCVSSVPEGSASVGIGMSGRPAFARTASPNCQYTFQKHPKYWIAFGDFEEGEVIDPKKITQKYEITFSEDEREKTIRFTGDNKWEEM